MDTSTTTGTTAVGPAGASLRAVAGLALLSLAVIRREEAGGLTWGLEPRAAVLGLVVLPAAMLAVALVGRAVSDRPIRFTGPVGLAVNFAIFAALFVIPQTSAAAALFYGASLLVAAGLRQPGCEVTVLSNVLLRRDDQIGCVVFGPVDHAEALARGRRVPVPGRERL